MLFAAFIILSFVISYLGVEAFRRWSLRKELLDIPNDRSSHTRPTPRGGGIVIVFVSLAAYIITASITGTAIAWGFVVGGVLVAFVSWLDDLYSLTFVWRFLVHCIAAAVVVFNVGYFSILAPFDSSYTLDLGVVGAAVTALWIVWVINAYNFMDGIDGIAGLQAVVAFIGWSAAAWVVGSPAIALFAAASAAACLGFLIHNWAPAKIFMGDVGSAFLGFSLASIPLLITSNAPASLPDMPILAVAFIWPFVFDTLLTFFRRLFRGEKVWTAHREHLYQRMIIAGRSHKTVSKIYGVLASIIVIAAFALYFWSVPWKYGVYAAMAFAATVPLYLAQKNVDRSL